MFTNKKLKERIKDLEAHIGYNYDGWGHSRLEDGDLRHVERKLEAVAEYLGIKNTATYGFFKFVKKDSGDKK